MAKVKKKFDFTEVEKMQGGSALPAGKYVCKITKTEMKKTSSGNGKYLSMEFTVCEGEFKGRKIFNNLNLENDSETAEKIAWEHYKGIHIALELDDFVEDSKELHGEKLILSTKVKKDEEYGDKTEIKEYIQMNTSDYSDEDEGEFEEKPKKNKKKKKKKDKE